MTQHPNTDLDRLVNVSRSHTSGNALNRKDSSGRQIRWSRRPLPTKQIKNTKDEHPWLQRITTCMPAGTTPSCAQSGLSESSHWTAAEQDADFYLSLHVATCFLKKLRLRCPKSISARMKGERLMALPEKAHDFRAALTAVRSFSPSEERCVRQLVINFSDANLNPSRGRSWKPRVFVSRESCSYVQDAGIRTLKRTSV